MPGYLDSAAKVLAKCAGNDPWFPKPDGLTVAAWAEHFAHHRLELPDLLEAVRVAYDELGAGSKVLPADIVVRARAIRRDRTEREPEADRQARIAEQDARPEVADSMQVDAMQLAEQRAALVADFASRHGRIA